MRNYIFGLMILYISINASAYACTMIPLSKQKIREIHEFVTEGTITQEQSINDITKDNLLETRDINKPNMLYTFSITKNIKGKIQDKTIIIPKNNLISCGGGLSSGSHLILYLNKGKNGYYSSSKYHMYVIQDGEDTSKITATGLGGPTLFERIIIRIQTFLY